MPYSIAQSIRKTLVRRVLQAYITKECLSNTHIDTYIYIYKRLSQKNIKGLNGTRLCPASCGDRSRQAEIREIRGRTRLRWCALHRGDTHWCTSVSLSQHHTHAHTDTWCIVYRESDWGILWDREIAGVCLRLYYRMWVSSGGEKVYI